MEETSVINPNSCIKCDISLTRKNMVNGHGRIPADIMFVGEAPGYYEDRTGIPFIGKSGEILSELLYLGGFEREDVFITNTIRCRTPGNRTPTPKEIKNCRVILQIEIFKVEPKIIVPLGNTATKVILNNLSINIGEVVGKAIKYKDYIIFPMYHPSYVLYGTKAEATSRMSKCIIHMHSLVEIYRNNVNSIHISNF